MVDRSAARFVVLAAIQTHSVALLMGWGGAMILGVALYFLPRLRGVKLARAQWAPVWFWLLALGLALRIGGQLLLATLNLIEPGWSVAWLNRGVVAGVALQAIGVGGLLGLLLITFRAGRPLKANEGFRQIAPLLGVAAFALSLAQLAWGAGVIQGLRSAPVWRCSRWGRSGRQRTGWCLDLFRPFPSPCLRVCFP